MGKVLRRLSALLHRRRLQQELAEEMAAHRSMMPADRRAHFGSPLHLQEQAADQWGFTWLDDLHQDLVYAARQLRRSPGFTLTAIAVLSLGIGVNLAEAHIFNAFLHRLHIRDAGSLYQLYRVNRRQVTAGFTAPAVEFYRRNNTAFSSVLTESRPDGIYHAQDSAELRCILVSGNYFGDLGIAPQYGRLLDEQDDRPGAPPVAVLSPDYWQSRFGGDPGIVMKTIRLNDKPVQVVGIAAQFGGIGWQANVWMASGQQAYLTGESRPPAIAMYGRLKPGVAPQAAQAQLLSLSAALRAQQPDLVDPSEWLKLLPADDRAPNPSAASLVLLTTCIVLVLLVLFSACANLGNMLLARGIARQREIDIRLAIGAGRGRLIRQLLTENLLLAALASIAALLTGRLAASLLLRIIGAPSDLHIVSDWRMVLAAAALGLVATLAFGLAPSLQMVRRGARPTRARKILVSVQVATSCVLLILSSFFTRSIQQNFRTEVTFDYSGLAVVDPALYMHSLGAAPARQAALEMASRLRQVPGVQGASLITVPPLRRSRIEHFSGVELYLNAVEPSYFATVRLPLVLGHLFAPDEPDAVVVAESAARRLWPNQPPLGKVIRIAQRDRTVAGVVKDSGANLIMDPESVEAYLPLGERDGPLTTVLVRTAGDPAAMAVALRSAATSPGITPMVFTLGSLVNDRLAVMRKMVQVIGSLAAIASLLALIGIFGLLAFTVAQRTREIGVRMALGARGSDILRIVLGQYLLPFQVGAAAGVALALAAARIMRTLLFGFATFDLVSVGAGLLLFAAVAVAASLAPARRALRIDPSSALRYE